MTPTTTTNDELPVDLPDVTEKWSMDDIRDHLETYHVGKGRGARLTSHITGYQQTYYKCRKESLLKLHDRLHNDEQYQYRDTPTQRARFNVVEHEHFALPEAQALSPDGKKLKTGDAPLLAQQERRTLKELVDSDFAGLRAELIQMADDALAEMLKAVHEEFKGTEVQARRFAERKTRLSRRHAEEKAKLANKHTDEVATLTEEARTVGLEPVPNSDAFQPANRDARISEVTSENKRDRDRALNTLERKRLGTQRTVLLTGLTGAAQLVLDTIPNAQRLMLEAAQERVQREQVARSIAGVNA